MKIRDGFVSNSSSFIVASENLPIAKGFELPFHTAIKNKESLINYFLEERCGCNITTERGIFESRHGRSYQACVEALENGLTVFFGKVSSETDSWEEAFICDRGTIESEGNGSLTVIEDLN